MQQPVHDRPVSSSAQRSIASLIKDLPELELERLAIDVIVRHRRYVDHAQSLFERLQADGASDDLGGLRHDYHLALVTLNGHHQVVSAVIDALGYVPEILDGLPRNSDGIDLN